nr:MAG TPA: Cytosine specific methyltransferase [Caudoviricetes sp.]
MGAAAVRYLSLFSGIEAASVAWEPAAFAELDEFPSAVLAERYPEVPNVGDVTKQ